MLVAWRRVLVVFSVKDYPAVPAHAQEGGVGGKAVESGGVKILAGPAEELLHFLATRGLLQRVQKFLVPRDTPAVFGRAGVFSILYVPDAQGAVHAVHALYPYPMVPARGVVATCSYEAR